MTPTKIRFRQTLSEVKQELGETFEGIGKTLEAIKAENSENSGRIAKSSQSSKTSSKSALPSWTKSSIAFASRRRRKVAAAMSRWRALGAPDTNLRRERRFSYYLSATDKLPTREQFDLEHKLFPVALTIHDGNAQRSDDPLGGQVRSGFERAGIHQECAQALGIRFQ